MTNANLPPWQPNMAPAIAKGDSSIRIHGKAPLVDIRILAEGNYQLALKSVNALPGVLQLLKEARSHIEMHSAAGDYELTQGIDAELASHGIKFTD